MARAPHDARVRRLTLLALVIAAGSSLALAAEQHNTGRRDAAHEVAYVAPDVRREMIRRARIWTPTDVAAMDVRLGPQAARQILPGATVNCSYRPRRYSHGHSPKFECVLPGGDAVKVKYGRRDPEVYAEVIATRLLWALGFGANSEYPVSVACSDCSSDPWHRPKPEPGIRTFDPAMIERRMKGHQIETHDRSGWSWSELDLIDANAGGAPMAHRDALKLLAVLLQHTDNKPAQQRLICLDHHWKAGDVCSHPFMYLHDVGLTFGAASMWNFMHTAGLNFEKWANAPVWKDSAACIGNLEKSVGGTFGNPRIGEAGRAFLATLLSQLTDRQIEDLFTVARVDRYSTDAAPGDWAAAFKQKRAQVVNHSCPS